jgi:hypothetical protein
MSSAHAIAMLRQIVDSATGLAWRVDEFRNYVFQRDEAALPGAVGEILCDLAYDLDYYEPDPRSRAEDPSFFGDARALELVRAALDAIEATRAGEPE